DVLVAATLLITALGFLTPWLLGGRDEALRQMCKNNLKQFSDALHAYKDNQGNGRDFPDVSRAGGPRKAAVLVIPMLIGGRTLPRGANVRCPGLGDPQTCSWTLEELQNMDAEQFERLAASLAVNYAYTLGHTEGGVYVGPRYDREKPNSLRPIMADAPGVDP